MLVYISKLILLQRFYINYVVCKLSIIVKIYTIDLLFYINYVVCKFVISPFMSIKKPPFYINYVVCKSIYNKQVFSINFAFYINYVVCKYKISHSISPYLLCFILTMWYVNSNMYAQAYDMVRSFILTMWYVNSYCNKKNNRQIITFYINYVVCK